MSVIDVIGLVSGAMGIWSFVADMIPSPTTDASTFKIWVGLDETGNPDDPGDCCLNNAGGGIDYIKLYNGNNALLGTGGHIEIGGGSTETTSVGQSVNNQALRAEFYATNDAICIAVISATLHDDTQWGWVGDWGRICGLDWYYSGVKQPQWDDNAPLCTWVDADHSEDIKAGVISIKWPGFTNQDLPSDGGQGKCGTDFEAWENDGGPSVIGSAAKKARGEDKPNRRRLTDDRLVVSSLPHQSAVDLCEDPRSRGPDFVSLVEGTHCNMYTREVLPLCGGDLEVGCFDLEAATAEGSPRLTSGDDSATNATRTIYW